MICSYTTGGPKGREAESTVARVQLIGVLAALAVAVLVQDGRPVQAAHTAIIVSRSNAAPMPVQSLIFYRNDPPVTLYVWAVNVDDPQGLAAFTLELDYSTLVANPSAPVATLTSFATDPTWLGTSGRSASCGTGTLPAFDNSVGRGFGTCFTLGGINQWGVQGTGLIGSFTIQPGAVLGSGTLNFAQSWLSDPGQLIDDTVIDPQVIPATRPNIPVLIPRCADFDGDGIVTLFGDIYAVAIRFDATPGDPRWDPIYDLDGNGIIDLFGDTYLTSRQFDLHCTP